MARRHKNTRPAKKKAIKFPDFLVADCAQDGFRELFIADEVFHSTFYLLTGDLTKEKYTAWAHTEFKCRDQQPYYGDHAWTHPVEMTDGQLRPVMVILGTWKGTEEQRMSLLHECHHATTFCLQHIGLKHSTETEEVWTYFQESLVRRFTWALNHPKDTVPCPRRKELRAPKGQ